MKYTVLQAAFAAAERVFQLLDEPTPAQRSQTQTITTLQQGIELRDVWFAYNAEDVAAGSEPDWVLRGLSLRIKRGEQVALVGATGSGKTTVLKLLNRSYDHQKGDIRIDGRSIFDYDLTSLRRLFAVVLQDVHLFSGTIMENLSLGGALSDEAVLRATRAVQADSFIQDLEGGYNAPVQDVGSNFSAGERQLLAFARALALDPEILVLDEATSNVDSETERKLQQALETLLEGRTALIVAHRLSTIRSVDRIAVIQRGEVIEQGSHSELMKQDGLYQRLVELQRETRAVAS